MTNKLKLDLDKSELERVWRRAFGQGAEHSEGVTAEEFEMGLHKSAFLKLMAKHIHIGHSVREFKTPPEYDYSKSTMDNYGTAHRHFHGDFVDIRQTRDYECELTRARSHT